MNSNTYVFGLTTVLLNSYVLIKKTIGKQFSFDCNKNKCLIRSTELLRFVFALSNLDFIPSPPSTNKCLDYITAITVISTTADNYNYYGYPLITTTDWLQRSSKIILYMWTF